jgi:hypothetical protein
MLLRKINGVLLLFKVSFIKYLGTDMPINLDLEYLLDEIHSYTDLSNYNHPSAEAKIIIEATHKEFQNLKLSENDEGRQALAYDAIKYKCYSLYPNYKELPSQKYNERGAAFYFKIGGSIAGNEELFNRELFTVKHKLSDVTTYFPAIEKNIEIMDAFLQVIKETFTDDEEIEKDYKTSVVLKLMKQKIMGAVDEYYKNNTYPLDIFGLYGKNEKQKSDSLAKKINIIDDLVELKKTIAT